MTVHRSCLSASQGRADSGDLGVRSRSRELRSRTGVACRCGALDEHGAGDRGSDTVRGRGHDVGRDGGVELVRLAPAGNDAELAGLVLGLRAGMRPHAHGSPKPTTPVSDGGGAGRRLCHDLLRCCTHRRSMGQVRLRLRDRRGYVRPRVTCSDLRAGPHRRRRCGVVRRARVVPRLVRLERLTAWPADRQRSYRADRARGRGVVQEREFYVRCRAVTARRSVGERLRDVDILATVLAKPGSVSEALGEESVSNFGQRCRLLTLVSSGMVVLLSAGCGGDSAPPSSTAPTMAAPAQAPTASAQEQRQVVEAAYTQFWPRSLAVPNSPEVTWREEMAALAVDPQLSTTLEAMRRNKLVGVKPYGDVTTRINSVDVRGDQATVQDCQDGSRSGQADATNGDRKTVGSPRIPIHAKMVRDTADGRWKVSQLHYPGGPC